MTASLDGVWEKIERAKEHRDSLDQYIRDEFSPQGNRPRVGMKFDSDSGQHVLYINYAPDFSRFRNRLALLIGDFTNNLRSALDYLVYQLAVLHTNDQILYPRRLQFTIANCLKLFNKDAVTERKRLLEVHPDHRATIEGLQPYHGRHSQLLDDFSFNPLTVLRDTSDTDKHRLLTPVLLTARQFGISEPQFMYIVVEARKQGLLQLSGIKSLPVELGAEVARAKLTNRLHGAEMDMTATVIPHVAFTEGWSVVSALDVEAALVIEIVRQFEPLF